MKPFGIALMLAAAGLGLYGAVMQVAYTEVLAAARQDLVQR